MDDEDGERLYIGHHAVFDDESEIVVVNWQAPVATRFYEATHEDPCGLRMKRTFQCEGNTILDFDDLVLAQVTADIAELETFDGPGDALLAELESNRTGSMTDIVRTIQAAQFDIIRAPMDQLLVVQGGPGTGKTAIALHRVSWLLFNHREQLSAQDILIVGPNPTFTRYTRLVLPSLGDTSVEQLDIHQLHPPVRRGRSEAPEVARLKGDARMAGLVLRGLYGRVGLPDDQQTVRLDFAGQKVALDAGRITGLIARCQSTAGTYTERRQLLRQLLTELVFDSASERLADELRRGPQKLRPALDPVMDRLWPSLTAPAFLRELFGSRDRLIAAAGDEFTAREVAQLHRRAADKVSEEHWSDADLAVLDEAEHLLNAVPARFSHIIVDEAQDLSPMQLRTVARRSSNGSFTIVGDIAQSTGLWARDDWHEVVRHIPNSLPQDLQSLRYGYRVPRQVFELAAQLLPVAAPDVQAPQVVREGPAEPGIHRTDSEDRASQAVSVAMKHASHGRSVAIICPASCRDEVEGELRARDVAWRAASAGELGPGINLVSPQEAKGLEFDSVVVVEPEDIVAEDARGHRLLYVALTRTTRYLDIVCVRSPLGLPASPEVEDPGSAGKVPLAPDPSVADDQEPAEADDPWGPVFRELLGEQSAPTVEVSPNGSADPTPEVRPPAPMPQGKASERIVNLAAEEVATLLRDTVSPKLWASVISRVGDLLNDQP